MIHDRLTDYQIASAFGDTLSLIYRDKIRELNEDLEGIYAHLDRLDIPKYTDFERWFAREALPSWAKEKLDSIKHINKIRGIYKKMKKEPESERLDIDRAKGIPIESLYVFKKKGKNVSCPFHGEDKSPSMSLKYNRFFCFSCGAKGSTIDFIMRLNSINFKESVEFLNKL